MLQNKCSTILREQVFRVSIFVLGTLILTTTVSADIKKVDQATREKDFKTADEAEKFYQTGQKHLTGDGVMKSYEIAAEKFEIAFSLGLKKVGLDLGQLYITSATGKVDIPKAISKLEAAALDDSSNNVASDAAYLLSQIYRGDNPGVTRSEETALKWVEIAAENNHVDAAAEIGFKYFKDPAIGMDATKAYRFTRVAAVRGHSGSQFNLGIMFYQGSHGVKKNLIKALAWFLVAKNTDPATDNGTIDIFKSGMRGSQVKAAEKEAEKLIKNMIF